MGRRKIPPAYFDYRQMPEVISPAHVAVYLGISARTVTTLAAKGQIPGRKVGDQWRFFRDDIRAMMEHRPATGLGGQRIGLLSAVHGLQAVHAVVRQRRAKPQPLAFSLHNIEDRPVKHCQLHQ
ncbi:MAG: helix-turn-helix domain-containing protein [Porticoccaceae bacterium]